MVQTYALSLKQPWAALVVAGLKTIEVRSWPTARRGRILIHAARIADERPEGWRHLPEEWLATAKLAGGIIGAAELTGCRTYADQEVFAQDCALHLNERSWWQGPKLYGFMLG